MENVQDYKISFFGEFMDKGLEREFFIYDMRRCSKVIEPVIIIFGIIYMMFVIADYLVINNTISFLIILIIRIIFLVISVVTYIAIKKIKDYVNLGYLITLYEMAATISFLLIIYYYESLTLLSYFSVAVITLAIYIMPNKIIYAQGISVFLILSFFVFHAKHIEGMDTFVFVEIISYNFIVLIYCNIGIYLTNYFKRKQFIDNRELLRVAVTDSLTGVFNRIKFNEELKQKIDCYNDYGDPLSLVIFDIDDFKKINDSYGHIIGDRVIQNIVLTVKSEIRHNDIFARWGGEEFVILLPNTGIHHAEEIVERLRSCIQNNKYISKEEITCSFGLVELRKYENSDSFLQRADKLLYVAKERGKNIIISETGKIEELDSESIS